MSGFLEFWELFSIGPLDVSPVDIAHYITWLGDRGTMAATSMHFYISAINKLLQDHARPLVALGPLVPGARKGIEICQRDEEPTAERLPMSALVGQSLRSLNANSP